MSVRSQHGAYVKLMSICRKMTQRPARTSYEWMVNHICIISDKVFQEYLFLFCCDIQWTKHLLTLILFIKVKVNTSTSAHTFSIANSQSANHSMPFTVCLPTKIVHALFRPTQVGQLVMSHDQLLSGDDVGRQTWPSFIDRLT